MHLYLERKGQRELLFFSLNWALQPEITRVDSGKNVYPLLASTSFPRSHTAMTTIKVRANIYGAFSMFVVEALLRQQA